MKKHIELMYKHELNLLSQLLRFEDVRHLWCESIDDSYFLTGTNKYIFETIKNNKNLSENEMFIEIENTGQKYGFDTFYFDRFYEDCTFIRPNKHSMQEIKRFKRYRELKKVFDDINPNDPQENSIKELYSHLDDNHASDYDKIAAKDSFLLIAKELQGSVELQNKMKPRYTDNDIDEIYGGFLPSLNIVSGRAGAGKTSKVLQIGNEFSNNNQDKINFFFSMEVGIRNIAQKICSYGSEVPLQNIKNLHFYGDYSKMFLAGREKISENFIIIECKTINVNAAKSYCEKIAKEAGKEIGLICFDYLQKMQPNEKANTKTEVMDNISADLCELGKEYIVFAISNLTKEDKNNNTCPSATELKGSSQIEYDAHTILMLWRPDAGNFGIVKSRLIKNRFGTPGIEINWNFKGEIGKFEIKKDYVEPVKNNKKHEPFK